MDSIGDKEQLFWKVFRNKYLWNKIVVVVDEKSYDHLIKFEEIINIYGIKLGILIIKEKVKKRKFIACSSFKSIFGRIYEDSRENYEFYNQLFEHYKDYFKDPNHVIPLIIKASNIAAFKVYINSFGIDNIQLNKIMDSYYKKINNNNNYNNNNYNYNINISININQYFEINSVQSFEFICYTLMNHGLPKLNIKSFNNIKITTENNLYYWLKYYKNQDITVGQLIKVIVLVIKLKLNKIKLYNKNSKLNKDKLLNKYLSTIINNNNSNDGNNQNRLVIMGQKEYMVFQIDSLNVRKQVSNEDCKDRENEKRKKLKKNDYYNQVLKELDSLSSQFTKEELETDFNRLLAVLNFLYKKSIVDKNSNRITLDFFNRSFSLRNTLFLIIRLYFNITGECYETSQKMEITTEFSSRNIAFHCIYFFRYLYNGLKGKGDDKYSIIVNSYQILVNQDLSNPGPLIAILELNDLKLLEQIHHINNILIPPGYLDLHFKLIYIVNSIKSVEILEFFFKCYPDFELFKSLNQLWAYLSSIEILKRLESLIESDKKTLAIGSFTQIIHPLFNIDEEFKPVYKNQNQKTLELIEYALKSHLYQGKSFQLSPPPSSPVYLSPPLSLSPLDIYTFGIPIKQYIIMNKTGLVFSTLKLLFRIISQYELSQGQQLNSLSKVIDLDKLLSSYPERKTLLWINNKQNLNEIILASKLISLSTIVISIEYKDTIIYIKLSFQLLFYSFLYNQNYQSALDLIQYRPNVFKNFRFEESISNTMVSIDFLIKATIKYFQILEIEQQQQHNNDDNNTLLKSNLKSIIVSYIISASATGNNQFFLCLNNNSDHPNLQKYLNNTYRNGETLLDLNTILKLYEISINSNNVEIINLLFTFDFIKQDIKDQLLLKKTNNPSRINSS